MKASSRVRIWVWIVVLPIAISLFLTVALREAARHAEGQPNSSELDRVYAESAARSAEQAKQARAAREAKHVEDAKHCARMVTPMLSRPDEGPLLIVLTGHSCRSPCELPGYANALMEDYARLGLGGVWVTLHGEDKPSAGEDRAPAMSRVVVSQCSAAIGGQSESWILLDHNDTLLGMAPLGPPAERLLPEQLEAMRTAVRAAVYSN